MAKLIDARGLACPQPVILARQAMEEADSVEILVDSDTSRQSLASMAAGSGWNVRVQENAGEYRITLAKSVARTEKEPAASEASTSSCVLVTDEGLGTGPDELRTALMKAFLHTLTEVTPLPREIIFLTNGVSLVCRGSLVIDDLRSLESAGVRLLACGTCLDYLDLMDRLEVGKVSNMYQIAETLLRAGNVVRV
jgi:selenium metabolism protein YedF